MKKFILALACISVAAAGCKKKIQELTVVDVDIPYTEVADMPDLFALFGIPPGTPTGGIPIPIPGYSFATDVNHYLALYNTSSDKVNSATLKSFGFKITTPPGSNFDFMDTVRVSISAKNQPEILAAWYYGIPKGIDTIALNVTNQELKPYFLQDSIYVNLSGYINATPVSGMQVQTTSVFHLNANPLN